MVVTLEMPAGQSERSTRRHGGQELTSIHDVLLESRMILEARTRMP
jgi:hypothetical protein